MFQDATSSHRNYAQGLRCSPRENRHPFHQGEKQEGEPDEDKPIRTRGRGVGDVFENLTWQHPTHVHEPQADQVLHRATLQKNGTSHGDCIYRDIYASELRLLCVSPLSTDNSRPVNSKRPRDGTRGGRNSSPRELRVVPRATRASYNPLPPAADGESNLVLHLIGRVRQGFNI